MGKKFSCKYHLPVPSYSPLLGFSLIHLEEKALVISGNGMLLTWRRCGMKGGNKCPPPGRMG